MLRTYTSDDPPKRGTAKKIYNALIRNGFTFIELHYNPNCWGNGARVAELWGTWVTTVILPESTLKGVYRCEVMDDGRVIIASAEHHGTQPFVLK